MFPTPAAVLPVVVAADEEDVHAKVLPATPDVGVMVAVAPEQIL